MVIKVPTMNTISRKPTPNPSCAGYKARNDIKLVAEFQILHYKCCDAYWWIDNLGVVIGTTYGAQTIFEVTNGLTDLIAIIIYAQTGI